MDQVKHLLTSPRYVFSNRPFTIRADVSLFGDTSLAVIMGVLMFFDALIISLMRGTPKVTFMEATPAKWKVFSVICVPGSPIDWAPTAPTVDPDQTAGQTAFKTVYHRELRTRFYFGFYIFHKCYFEELPQLCLRHPGLIIHNEFLSI